MYIEALLSIIALPLMGVVCWITVLVIERKEKNDKTK